MRVPDNLSDNGHSRYNPSRLSLRRIVHMIQSPPCAFLPDGIDRVVAARWTIWFMFDVCIRAEELIHWRRVRGRFITNQRPVQLGRIYLKAVVF